MSLTWGLIMRRLQCALFAAVAAIGFASIASAADMPVKAVRGPIAAPVYNWTGFYVGGFGGGLWGKKDWTFLNGATTGHTANGFLGGAQIGYNWQAASWVFGIQGDWGWSGAKGSSACPNAAFTCETQIKSLGSVTGRVGYAWNNVLAYVKGGGAWIKDDYKATSGANIYTGSNTPGGWTVGTGLEYGFTPNWSAFVEYDYYNFGTHRIVFTNAAGATDNFDSKQRVGVIKGGVNFRFTGL